MSKTHVIYGPPGTGKSTELIARMKSLINAGTLANRVFFVAFTKAAAVELEQRIGNLGIQISTLHSLAFRLSGTIRDQVVDYHKLKEFSKLIGIDITGANPDENESLAEGDEYLALVNLAAAKMVSFETIYMGSSRPGGWAKFIYFAEGYEKWKKSNGYVDFNDMLINASLMAPPNCSVMFVDEAQDLSDLQWALISHWESTVPEIHLAGDDDQAIFVWGGANPHGMDDFAKRTKAECRTLTQSYRIPARVHRVAHGVLENVTRRVSKDYLPRSEEGTVRRFGDVSRIEIDHGEDCMVLYRNHSMRSEIEEYLIRKALPYKVVSGKPGILDNWAATAIRCWDSVKKDMEQLGDSIIKPNDLKKLRSMLRPQYTGRFDKNPQKFIDENEWESVFSMKYEHLNYLQKVLDKYGSLSVKPTIMLNTIHGAKGKEAERVVLINGMGKRTMESMQIDADSEYRTFYVAVTRAKHELDIVEGENPIRIAQV